jgi:hypothetical protein
MTCCILTTLHISFLLLVRSLQNALREAFLIFCCIFPKVGQCVLDYKGRSPFINKTKKIGDKIKTNL